MARMRWLHDGREDLWFGCRRLTRDLDATTAIVLVLACGIGLSVAMFAVADTVLRRPLPILDQERVVVLWGEAGGSTRTLPLSPQHFDRFRHEARTLQEVAGTLSIDSWAQPVRDGEQTFRVNLSPVTGNFFVVLGSTAVLGRTLVPHDDLPGAAPVAVLSYSLWRGRFAGNPAVLGRRLELRNSRVVTVVGVAPPGLEYPVGTEIWVPFSNLSAVEVMPLGAEYFETMGIRLLSGRTFNRNDRRDSAPVAMVSEHAARLLGVENGAVGRRIRFPGSPGDWRTIVGVAADTRYRALREAAPTVYLPLEQFTEVMTLITTLVVRTDGRPAAAIPSIRDAVAQTDGDVVVLHAAALTDLVSRQFAGPRLHAVLLSLFGAGAALLAAVGLYSLLAAAVKARRRELAIRQAIGATPARLRRIVVVQGIWLCGAGLAFGLAGGLAFGRLLGTVLYGVAPNDVYTVAGVVVLVVIISVAASYVPARRATTADVFALLRNA